MATPSLLARVADIWSRDFASLPVHRDLPRLTNQLEIAEGASHTIYLRDDEHAPRGTSVRDILTVLAAFLPDYLLPIETDERDKRLSSKEKKRRKGERSFSLSSAFSSDSHSERDVGDPLDGLDGTEEQGETVELLSGSDDYESCTEFHLTRPIINGDYDTSSSHQDFDDDDLLDTLTHTTQSSLSLSPSLSVRRRSDSGQSNRHRFAKHIQQELQKHIKDEGGDISIQMESFFHSKAVSESGAFIKLLKTLHQEIISPVVMDLRSAIYETFRYKDVKGTWRIRIEFFLDTPPIIDPVSASSKRLAQLQSQSVDSTGRRTSVPLIGNEGASKKSAPIAARRVSTGTHPPAQHKLKAAARNAANFTTATATKNVSAPAATTMAHQMTGGDISALLNIIPCPAVNKIRVMHRKREQSYDCTPGAFFEFEWMLVMTFDPSMSEMLSADVHIVDLKLSKDLSKERRESVLNSLRPFFSPEMPYNLLWRRPLSKLSLSKELLKIVEFLEIYNHKGKMLYKGATVHAQTVFNLLLVLAEHLHESSDLVQKIEGTFFLVVPMKGDITKPLKHFLASILHDDDDNSAIVTAKGDKDVVFGRKHSIGLATSPLTMLLKALVTDLLEPAEELLRAAIGNAFLYKRQGPVGVSIHIAPSLITVTRRYRASGSGSERDHSVKFVWELELRFDAGMQALVGAKISVIDVLFPPIIEDSWRVRALTVLEPFSRSSASTSTDPRYRQQSHSQPLLHPKLPRDAKSSQQLTIAELLDSLRVSLEQHASNSLASSNGGSSAGALMVNGCLPQALPATSVVDLIRLSLADLDRTPVPLALIRSVSAAATVSSTSAATSSSLSSSTTSATSISAPQLHPSVPSSPMLTASSPLLGSNAPKQQ